MRNLYQNFLFRSESAILVNETTNRTFGSAGKRSEMFIEDLYCGHAIYFTKSDHFVLTFKTFILFLE